MSSQVEPRPALLNPDHVPGEPYVTDEEMTALWLAVSFSVDEDMAGVAVNELDELAAKGNRVAVALLFTLAAEGAQTRLSDREPFGHGLE